MEHESGLKLSTAQRVRSIDEALSIMECYPRNTPVVFDYLGTGDHGRLTVDEVVRTRKINSRISNEQVTYFVERAATADWDLPGTDLADADPSGDGLFAAMSELYWHFFKDAPKGVNIAKISKVLHLKLPALFPMLDSHVARAYAPSAKALRTAYPQFGRRRRIWIAVRKDLVEARKSGAMDELRRRIRTYESADIKLQNHVRLLDGLTDLRLLDILVWND